MDSSNQLPPDKSSPFTKDDAYRTLEIINTWINNIDVKVSFELSISGILIGFVFNKGIPNAFKRIIEINKLAELNGGELIAAILVILLYLTSFISIFYLMLSILARTKMPNNTHSIFFFGSIASQKVNDYKGKINNMSEKEIIEDLEEQIHINSIICSKKAKFYNIGARCLLIDLILWFICMSFGLI